MYTLENAVKIQQNINNKYAVEMQLAKALLKEFNTGGTIDSLRLACQHALPLAEQVYNTGSVEVKAKFVAKLKIDFGIYDCFTKHGVKSFDVTIIRNAARTFTASECGDFIRVFGEIFEGFPAFEGSLSGNVNQQRLAPQLPAGDHFNKKLEQGGTRDRFPTAKNVDNSIIHTELRKVGKKNAGILRWTQGDKDTCGKLDRIFGLCPGATISGTTTDNIFFFDKLKMRGLDPLLYLLPAAAIVGEGHHTMIEVALPLSMNGKMDYTVGKYTTLLPKASGSSGSTWGMDRATVSVAKILHLYEKDPRNKLMLIWYKQSDKSVEGAYVFEPDNGADMDRWDRIAKATKDMMDKTLFMEPAPSKASINKLMSSR